MCHELESLRTNLQEERRCEGCKYEVGYDRCLVWHMVEYALNEVPSGEVRI